MTEPELFSAYRHANNGDEHWASDCACGDTIVSEKGDELSVGSAIRIHNESPLHSQWATWQEAVRALQRPTRRKCPCSEHAA